MCLRQNKTNLFIFPTYDRHKKDNPIECCVWLKIQDVRKGCFGFDEFVLLLHSADAWTTSAMCVRRLCLGLEISGEEPWTIKVNPGPWYWEMSHEAACHQVLACWMDNVFLHVGTWPCSHLDHPDTRKHRPPFQISTMAKTIHISLYQAWF